MSETKNQADGGGLTLNPATGEVLYADERAKTAEATQGPPPLFEGATHRIAGGEPVKAVRWVKDGDHPLVERYPIEGRAFKGMLTVDAKTKFGLRFGEWILEDAKGRIWVESSQELPARYVAIEKEAA